MTLLPLINSTYGNTDDHGSWCFFVSNNENKQYIELMWVILSFYGWIISSIFIILFFIIHIYIKLSQMAIISSDKLDTINRLVGYPIILIICWLPAAVTDIIELFQNHFSALFFHCT